MRFQFSRLVSDFDWWLMASALGLAAFGLLLLYSLGGSGEKVFLKQFIFLIIGLGGLLATQLFDQHWWRNAAIWFYGVCVIFLLALLIFGVVTRGARGWFYFAGLGLQPAEFTKIAVIMFLAMVLERIHFDIANFRHLLLVLLLVGLPVALVLAQPDFGSAFVIMAMSAVMVLYTGLDRKKFLALLGLAVAFGAIAWFGFLQDYQKARVLTFITPQADPRGAGYNVRQAIVATGSGGLWGRGLGGGTQSQLNFLPEQTTDFIFASLAEELGFIGGLTVLGLYVFLLWRIYLRMRTGADLFTNFLLLGIFTMILTQAVINIGMNMGLFPVTGITLPLISYGGSSLLVTWFALGLVQNAPR